MSYNNDYSQYGGNPYQQAPAAESGYGQQPTEMSSYGAPQPTHTSNVLSQQDFLSRVDFAKSEIRNLTSSIQQISALHQRALSATDNSTSAQLENLVTQTQLKNTQIRDQIKFLEVDAAKTQDGSKSLKTRQAKQLKTDFEKELEGFRQEELGYQQRYREQIARQYLIVNPDATQEEIQEATEADWGSEGVFQTALKNNRSGQASAVLGAVRARHNELQRIERTLEELANMFADMAQLVETQEPVIEHTENNAIKTVEDVRRGNTEIEKANEHARRRNRLKWYCLLIVVIICIIIALGVGLGVALTKNK